MKILRYQSVDGKISWGQEHVGGTVTRIDGDLFGDYQDYGEIVQIAKRLAPVEPRDIICIGLNYRKHAEEGNLPILEFPVVFMENISALQYPGEPILLPRRLRRNAVDFECELAVVIGKECYNVSSDQALSHVLGYTCANDVSARGWQMNGAGANGAVARLSPRSAPAW